MARSESSIFSGAIWAVLIAYPVLVYFGLRYGSLQWLAFILIGMFVLRLVFLMRRSAATPLSSYFIVIAVAGAILALVSAVAGEVDAMLYYPVLMNIMLLYVFAQSLLRPPSVIERLARLKEADLPPRAIAYTRKVTVAWVVFFLLNASISLYTVIGGSIELWTLYNGFISYVLIACMFAGELLIRSRMKSRSQ